MKKRGRFFVNMCTLVSLFLLVLSPLVVFRVPFISQVDIAFKHFCRSRLS